MVIGGGRLPFADLRDDDDPAPTPVSPPSPAEDAFIAALGGGAQINVVLSDPEDPGNYSVADAYSYYQVRDFLQDSYEIGAVSAGALVNEHGRAFFDRHGTWPQAWQVIQSEAFNQDAARIPTGADLLPSLFVMEDVLYQNTPEAGPIPVPLRGRGRFGAMLHRSAPRLTQDQVMGIMNLRAPSARGGGGGGGGGRRAPVFDKATIGESIRSLYQFYLKDEPGDKLDTYINDYVREATAFARQGGNLGLEAWTKGRLETEQRWDLLYSNKPDHVDPAQWLGRYEQVALGAGLRDSSVIREVERGASQGIGLGGFQKQIQRAPEVRAGSGFTRSLASTVAELGTLGRT